VFPEEKRGGVPENGPHVPHTDSAVLVDGGVGKAHQEKNRSARESHTNTSDWHGIQWKLVHSSELGVVPSMESCIVTVFRRGAIERIL